MRKVLVKREALVYQTPKHAPMDRSVHRAYAKGVLVKQQPVQTKSKMEPKPALIVVVRAVLV